MLRNIRSGERAHQHSRNAEKASQNIDVTEENLKMILDLLREFRVRYLPPVLNDFIRELRSQAQFWLYSNKDLLTKNFALKDIGSGKRAFVLCTGPSINRENLKVLAGEDCFSASNFYLHDDVNLIKPKFHFFAPYHEPMDLVNYAEWLKAADAALPKETAIFLGHSTKPIVDKHSLFPGRDVYFLYLADVKPSFDITKPLLAPQTVPLMIIPVLAYMGYDTIYLLGCDHDVIRDYKSTIHNFYEPSKDMRTIATNEKSWAPIITELQTMLNVFLQYKSYGKLLKHQNIRIVNLSYNSWLDFFEIGKLIELKFPE